MFMFKDFKSLNSLFQTAGEGFETSGHLGGGIVGLGLTCIVGASFFGA